MNSILPPREFTELGTLYVKYVSPKPASKQDVSNLVYDFKEALEKRSARLSGICTIREELYSQCFDELIRQITIECAERGFLLVRVRDEMRMNIQAYQSLYESCIANGARKALTAEQYKTEMHQNITKLRQDCEDLDNEAARLNQQIIDIATADMHENDKETAAHNK